MTMNKLTMMGIVFGSAAVIIGLTILGTKVAPNTTKELNNQLNSVLSHTGGNRKTRRHNKFKHNKSNKK